MLPYLRKSSWPSSRDAQDREVSDKTEHRFGHGVEVEHKNERPLKQAIAVAYAQKQAAKHVAHGGKDRWSDCEACYALGGEIRGVHKPHASDEDSGMSMAGMHIRASKEPPRKNADVSPQSHQDFAKDLHKGRLHELKTLPKPKLYAQGGYIPNPTEAQARSGYAVHSSEKEKPTMSLCRGASCPGCPKCMAKGGKVAHMDDGGMLGSIAKLAPLAMMLMNKGGAVEKDEASGMREDHSEAFDRMQVNRGGAEKHSIMEGKAHYDKGGDIDGDGDDDDMMMDIVAEELMSAIKSGNKKELLEAIRAIVLSCKQGDL